MSKAVGRRDKGDANRRSFGKHKLVGHHAQAPRQPPRVDVSQFREYFDGESNFGIDTLASEVVRDIELSHDGKRSDNCSLDNVNARVSSPFFQQP